MEQSAQQLEQWAVEVVGDAPPLLLEHIHEYAVTLDAGPELVVVTTGEQGPPGIQGLRGPSGENGQDGAQWGALEW